MICTSSIVVEVSDLNGPTANIISSTNISCYSYCDGSATVNMTGGTGNFFTVLWDNNAGSQTSPTASNLCAGTYTVIITDNVGCNSSTSVIITEPDSLQYIRSANHPSCFGYCDGELWVNIIGGTQPYSYDWMDNSNTSLGVNNDSISGLCAGFYNLLVNDANGCTIIVNYQLIDPAQILVSTTVTDALCFGSCDGTITANGINGNAPYSYIWVINSGSQTTQTAFGLCVGNYSVTVTDNDGCFNTAQATVNEPTLLSSSISISGNLTCYNACDGFAQADAQGGTPGYTYIWNNNAGINQTATGLCAGSYTVTVFDNNNCTTTSSITLTEPQPLSASSTTINLTCYHVCQGQASVFTSGGTTPYSYQWDDPGFSNTSSISGLCAGTYNCVITDALGCSYIETIIITEPMELSMSITTIDANCGQSNGQICMSVIGGIAPYTYQWNDPFTQTTSCAYNLFSSCYTGMILDANSCSIDSVICINNISGPVINLVNSNDITCYGFQNGLLEFNVTGGTGSSTIEWFDNQGNIIPQGNGVSILTNLDGGCYSIQATDNAGCVTSLSACINEPNPLSASIFNYNDASCYQYCDGYASVSIAGGIVQNDYSYSWNDPNTQSTQAASGLCTGSYTVTVTDDNNCQIQSSVTINEPSPINTSVLYTNNASCYDICDGIIQITSSGGTLPHLYNWDNGSFGTTTNNLCNGNYTVYVHDANGCLDSLVASITEPDSITLSSTITDATCFQCNGEVSIQATGGTSPFNYNWYGIGNSPSNSTNNGLCSGPFQVEVSDANGCVSYISDNINDIQMPSFNFVSFTSPTCYGLSNGSATASVSGGVGPYSYLWDDPAQQQVSTAVALSANTYCVTVTDNNGCMISNCITISQPTTLNAVPDLPDTICYGDSTQVWASGQGGTIPYTIHWVNPNLFGSGPLTVNPLTTTDYCFSVSDTNGCISNTACVTITVNPPLSLSITPSMNICSGDSVDVSAIASGGNYTPYVFSWIDQYNNVFTSNQSGDTSTISILPPYATWYYVTLNDGCSIEVIDSTLIGINPSPQALVIVIDSTGCAPFTAQFIINSDIGDHFEFDIDCDSIPEYSGSNNTFTYTYTTSGLYDVCINVTNSATGCETNLYIPNMILVYDLPIAFFPFPKSQL